MMSDTTHEYSEFQLDETLPRSATFFQGLSAEPTIYAILRDAGLTPKIFDHGRQLLFEALALSPKHALPNPPNAREQATVELDSSDESLLARIRSHLGAKHKQTLHFLIGDLSAGTGTVAVNNIATFLQRRAVLVRHEPSRAAFRAEDDSALALLAERHIDDAECARLQKLVDTALSPSELADDDGTAQRIERLVALRLWYDEWAGVARALVTKRAHLIRLGLAKRRARKAAGPAPVVEPTEPDEDDE